MVGEAGRAKKVLIVNPGAGSVGEEDATRLRQAFPDYLQLTLEPGEDLGELLRSAQIAEDARVVAVGGDGTVRGVAKALAGTQHPFGIVPRGTFNNFARALGIPLEFDAAMKVVQRGRATPVTLGRVNGEPFLEAAAIGLFGEALALGEASKDLHYGDVLKRAREVVTDRPFRYKLSGDLTTSGEARSLIVANTPFTGARIVVSDSTPADPRLEVTVNVGRTRFDLLKRLVRALIRRPAEAVKPVGSVSKLRVETSPSMRVYADVSEVGETPVEIEAVPAGLTVIL